MYFEGKHKARRGFYALYVSTTNAIDWKDLAEGFPKILVFVAGVHFVKQNPALIVSNNVILGAGAPSIAEKSRFGRFQQCGAWCWRPPSFAWKSSF